MFSTTAQWLAWLEDQLVTLVYMLFVHFPSHELARNNLLPHKDLVNARLNAIGPVERLAKARQSILPYRAEVLEPEQVLPCSKLPQTANRANTPIPNKTSYNTVLIGIEQRQSSAEIKSHAA